MASSATFTSVAGRQGFIEALSCICGCALAVAIWWGLNAIMSPTTLNMTAMLAD